jgi:choline dehydrogenase
VGSDPDDTQPLIDWGFVTTPQAGIQGRRTHYARGKTLGGSSARNYLAYHRGTNGSYQQWADEFGDESYLLSNLDQYFDRIVNMTDPDTHVRRANVTIGYNFNASRVQDGQHHPLHLSWPNWIDSISTWSFQAFRAMGLASIPSGFESGDLTGYFYNLATLEPASQHRSSSQTSFFDYAIRATSIKVYAHTLARQIHFTGNKTASGILVQSGDKNYTLAAKREVILSAGAFQSPQLLMLSGVGPRETLQQ